MPMEFEDMVKKDFQVIGEGLYSTYILPSSSKTTPPLSPTMNPFPPPPAALPTFNPPPNSSYIMISPPTLPDMPSSSYSTSTSLASTATPPTPPAMEGYMACIISASSSPGVPKHKPVPAVPHH
ncbi:hypothetical protein EDD22DRAFT_955791 [Suillus occidentalis]|nr:hypothetical protein EDD22DRAFT_955791 [Suillus occidentalis]